MKSETWIIKDWAGNDLTPHHGTFASFDDAEEALSVFLGDSYETDRGEYVVCQKINTHTTEYSGADALSRIYGRGK